MAIDFSKLNIFTRLDARARIFVLIGAVFGIILIIYLMTKYFAGGGGALGPSSVANVPAGLQTIPGGTQTQQFSKAVEQANLQRAQQAKISGQSAVPTLVNLQQPMGGQAQCVICSDEAVNVKDTLDDWVQRGKVSPEVAKTLSQLAAQDVSPEDFADQLNQLVASGKLSPEQARVLLDQYNKQHDNTLLSDSSKTMDNLIKGGQLPLGAANELLAMQKAGASTTEYARKLQQLVDDEKISPAVAQQLLSQYTQQQAKEAASKGRAHLRRMVSEGQLTPDAAKDLAALQERNVPMDLYKQTVDQMVASGKITPAVAKKILEEYAKQKTTAGPIATANQMLKNAEDAAYGEINDLMNAKKMSPEVGSLLTGLIQKNVSLNEFQGQLATLVQQNKLSPEIAKLKYADYQAVTAMRDLKSKLAALQANNASVADYEKALKGLVQSGAITPAQAAQLMQEYQAVRSQAPTTMASAPSVSGPGTEEFAKLQQRLQQGAPAATQPIIGAEQFATVETQTQEAVGQAAQERVQTLVTAMSGQAQQLITSWQATPMIHKEGEQEKPKDKLTTGTAGGAEGAGAAGQAGAAAAGPVLIKAGSILFAVLDTAVNSDYPDTPVMATIVDGKYKGSKLIGKLSTSKGVAGQMDRVSLSFNMMNNDDWPKSKAVTAFAIDPDTAKTVLASSVNYHYLQRFGAIMATSFVQGYANAIASSSSTSTTSALGSVSSTHPELSPGQKLATAIGQIGTALGSVTQGYTSIPPTVKVDSGVGLGILFMADLS